MKSDSSCEDRLLSATFSVLESSSVQMFRAVRFRAACAASQVFDSTIPTCMKRQWPIAQSTGHHVEFPRQTEGPGQSYHKSCDQRIACQNTRLNDAGVKVELEK